MKLLLKILTNIWYNFYTFLCNCFVRRDKNIWLFGAWMGNNFSDNSRFLFQYLHNNKNKYDIKKVIWVTRSSNIYQELQELHYDVFLIGTKQSRHWHLKAGVHVICNSRETDIDCRYSFGAKKIQLWHGNGIKACGRFTKKGKVSLKDKIWDRLIKPLLLPGRWFYCFWLACSKENKRVLIGDSLAQKNKIIIACYPRLCTCEQFLKEERNILNIINKFKQTGFKIIMYLPTFRKVQTEYLEPTGIEGFDSFLTRNKILWIQKKHFVDNEKKSVLLSENVLNLPSNFDINVIYDYLNLLITDYSSASSDAIYKNINTLEYCPDFDFYASKDRGFVAPFETYHVNETIKNHASLFDSISNILRYRFDRSAKHEEVKKLLFDDSQNDFKQIMNSILNSIFRGRHKAQNDGF